MFYMEIECWGKWDQLLGEVDSSAKLCEVRQVMEAGKCTLARRLKLCWWIALLSYVGAQSDGRIVNE